MCAYPQGVLDFCQLRFWSRDAAIFKETPVVLFCDHRNALLGAHDAEQFLPADVEIDWTLQMLYPCELAPQAFQRASLMTGKPEAGEAILSYNHRHTYEHGIGNT